MILYRLLFVIACLGVGASAYGRDGDFHASASGSLRLQKTSASGALLGSLAPLTPFSEEDSDDDLGVAASLGYDHFVGSAAFIGVEALVDVGSLNQLFVANASASATQTVIRCYPTPPPFFDYCEFGAEVTTTQFDETQTLNLDVETGPSAALVGRVGVGRGPVRAWVFGGVSTQRLRARYELPAVATAIPPIVEFVEGSILEPRPMPGEAVTTTLPAESANLKKQMTGWTAGAGIEHRISGQLSILARYTYADHGSVTFPATARLAPTRIASKSHSFGLGLSFHF